MRKKHLSSKLSLFIDYKIFIPVIILSVIGLVAILDVSAPKAMETFSDRFYFAKQQLLWIIGGVFIFLIISQITIKLYEKYALVIFILSLILLVLVLIPGIGTKTLGARRWIDLGLYGFQPSEFAKLALCIYMAKISSVKENILAFIFPLSLTIFLILLQPDLGTSIVISAISLTQIFMSKMPLKKFIPIAVAGILVCSIAIATSSYRRERVMSFINPFTTVNDGNYHIRQVIYALALGGFDGTGIGQSMQKYLFLPESTTDSIFAVIGEETGFMGVTIITSVYIFTALNLLKKIRLITDAFSQSLMIGIFTWFVVQVFINLGSVSSLIPFTGVPLPFISYGGSTLISLFMAMGIFNSAVKYNRYENQ